MMEPANDTIISVRGLVTQLGGRLIHDHVDLDVRRGEVIAIVGGSGSGKSVLLRTIIGLLTPHDGHIEVFGENAAGLDSGGLRRLQRRWGVLFQDGALYSSQTVAENIQVPLREYAKLPQQLMDEIAGVKLHMVGLSEDAGSKYPSELSGGMRKRAGLARALVLDPEIVFLDEPTAGLDPIAANAFDMLIRNLQQSLGLTVFMVTHDLDTLRSIADRVAVLVNKTLKVGTIEEVMRDNDPWIQEYFSGPRGRAAMKVSDGNQS
ncbi:phospholipid/cholesterol/gamma-HCH transport system ATP-binding protein [Rhizomicrobium palustre]|uniref:Phospholipid/cholesterol/gamma-HCH transport system ATP-binding protein n=2 Tax=Rhizomicrobium palustre TaxID=189966 RepID=A0A846MVT2_9PROT|nr:ABC transporter ATP-binding protein [Rhizomicrobium palustre]NIK87271.1 phospholipid/cholesterol/gamma-HCH transport system ATP-binding protein [Rhizomicrobium palustre]